MQPIELEVGAEVVPLTSASNQCEERGERSKRNNKKGLRHNNKKHIINDKRSSTHHLSSVNSLSTSNQLIVETEANIEEEKTQQHDTTNRTNNNATKRRRRSSLAFAPLRKKISRKMSMAFSSARSSNNGLERVDISGFQLQEQQKTAVRKNLKWHATFLFFLAVVATGIVLLDTQIKVQWDKQRTFLSSLDHVASQNTTDQGRDADLQAELDKLETYKNAGIGLKAFLSFVSILTCISLLYYYKNLFRLKKVRHFFPQKMSFVRATPLLKKYMIEFIICFFHVPPYLDLYVEVPNEVQIFVLLRLYLLGRYLKEKHELMNSQSTRFLASVTKTELTSMFLFKTFFMQYPFQMILLAYVILLFIGGYGVWMIENQYSYLVSISTFFFVVVTFKWYDSIHCLFISLLRGRFLLLMKSVYIIKTLNDDGISFDAINHQTNTYKRENCLF